jgi:putative DNA primase/helicase
LASGILGTYHKTAPIETFTASRFSSHPTELAGLHGARLVTSVETEQGGAWAESRICTLTGGDKISARFMRQDFFEFLPGFKLMIAGNHKPRLRVGDAIRRRFQMIPFAVKIANPDKDLAEKLKAEWPAILLWMVEGCAEWQRQGLDPPHRVIETTNKYLEAEDSVGLWLEDYCQVGAYEATSYVLYSSWKVWAENAGERPGNRKDFSKILESRGFEMVRIGKDRTRGYKGLRVNPIYERPADDPVLSADQIIPDPNKEPDWTKKQ